MRILFHHRTLADGAEGIHIAESVNAFRALGHDVLVVGAAGAGARGAASDIAGRIRAIVPEPMMELVSLAHNVPEFVQMGRAIDTFGPDLIYKRHARFDLAPLLVAQRRRIPVVLEVNAVYSARPYCDFEPLAFRNVARTLERRAFARATTVVTVSTPLVAQVRALADVPTIVVPNGVDPRRFDVALADADSVRARFGLTGRLTVGWTGMLRAWHGLEVLVEAVAAVPGAYLLIVGDGPARRDLMRRADALGLADRLVVTGRVSHERMPDFIAAMDIAVVADERTGVASPMKLLEYMAMNRAIVAPRVPGVTDIVTDGEEALLFAPGDRWDLARVLRELAATEGRRRELGVKARRTVEQRRNWQHNARIVLDTLNAESNHERLSFAAR